MGAELSKVNFLTKGCRDEFFAPILFFGIKGGCYAEV